jgi:hypothetical protein
MAVLATVADYLSSARTLLQDTVETYRYSSADLVFALNVAISEMARLRPDLYFVELRDSTVPTSYSSSSTGTAVALDLRYRLAVVEYMVGYVQLRDDEETQDKRAGALLSQFTAKLMSVQA